MNLALPESEVRRLCLSQGVGISVVEPLPSGGTRLVCTTGIGADEMRLRLRGHLIDGAVTRHRFYRPPGAKDGY
ncbi:hypothetical protein FHR22_000852 [Sphingopyxis panaciterrae]|uniref:hypothetical protein n=1 Tax=Sphingopyxis panaciterrae TaxID=363841 RepID=UPI003133233D|nr:hypothetical protein [Sphingopyxis panaciterrae]